MKGQPTVDSVHFLLIEGLSQGRFVSTNSTIDLHQRSQFHFAV